MSADRSVRRAGALMARALAPREWFFLSDAVAKRLRATSDVGERLMLNLLFAKLGQAGKALNAVPDRTPGRKAALTRKRRAAGHNAMVTRHRRAGARKAWQRRRARA